MELTLLLHSAPLRARKRTPTASTGFTAFADFAPARL